jgi:4-amino-4-deoxy-L-arabinose transferase-like glycosyltransferase
MDRSFGLRSKARVTSLRTGVRENPWLVVSIALCLFGLTYNFAGYALLDPDEGRNAEVAREMAAENDYILPHLNGLPYLDKPILYFATGAATMELLGPTVLAARLPSLFFTFATLALVGWFGARLFGRRGAWIAVIATASMPFTLAYSRTVIFDSTLTFFVVLALMSFYLAIETAETAAKGLGWTTLAWAAMALGVLTKGPVALAVPLMVAVPFAIWRRTWRAILDPLSVLVFAALVAPWVFAVLRQVPDFLHYVLVTETARRLTTGELQRTGPIWYFLAVLPAAALPWFIVAAGSWRSLRWRDRYGNMDGRIVYLLLWIVVPLIFFTLSQSKRPQYVLPLVPAIALLVAAAWSTRPQRLPGLRLASGTLVVLGAVLIAGGRLIPGLVSASANVSSAIPGTALVLGVACVASGLLALFAHSRVHLALMALSIPVATIPLASQRLMDVIGRDRSTLEIAQLIESTAGPDARVIAVGTFPLSLPFYLRRTMLLATEDGSELTSNYITRHYDRFAGQVTMRSADWWRTALIECATPTVFVLAIDDSQAREILRSIIDLLVATRKYAAYGPCGVTDLALAGKG